MREPVSGNFHKLVQIVASALMPFIQMADKIFSNPTIFIAAIALAFLIQAPILPRRQTASNCTLFVASRVFREAFKCILDENFVSFSFDEVVYMGETALAQQLKCDFITISDTFWFMGISP